MCWKDVGNVKTDLPFNLESGCCDVVNGPDETEGKVTLVCIGSGKRAD